MCQISSGQENSPLGPNALPNGQPSQWSRPPSFPQLAKLPRPVASTQNFQYPTSAFATNGIQMPNPGMSRFGDCRKDIVYKECDNLPMYI